MAKPARFTKVPTVAEVVKRAIEAVDPAGREPALPPLERWFEDDDEPITAVSLFDERLALASDGLDPELENPALAMAIATALYLSFRRDVVSDANADDLLRLAARAEWKGKPPSHVGDWLAERGIEV
jgi:hypothetical protein